MTSRRYDRWADITERAVWTLLQAGVGVSVVVALNIPEPWAVVIAGVLAVAKGELATKFGDGTAATLPATPPTDQATEPSVSGSATTEES
jgi:hypothetical protein